MPKLAHLNQPAMPPAQDFWSAMLNNLFSTLTQSVVANVEQSLVQHDQKVDMVAPLVQNALKQALAELAPMIGQINARLEQGFTGIAQLHQKTIEAMGRIEIPNYAEQLARLEMKGVDLSAISDQIEALRAEIEEDERPTEWRFEVQRDSNGSIKTVDAYAVEDEE